MTEKMRTFLEEQGKKPKIKLTQGSKLFIQRWCKKAFIVIKADHFSTTLPI